jgi:hypothetical protein
VPNQRPQVRRIGAAWDCDGVSDKPIKKAKPFLTKHCIMGKSTPRTRAPRRKKGVLEEHFAKQNLHPNCFRHGARFALAARFVHPTHRRVVRAPVARLELPKQTILVRKMKDPKNRASRRGRAAMGRAGSALRVGLGDEREARAPQRRASHPAVQFQDVQPALYKAKKLLGIENLHLHDSRRDRGSRLVEEDGHSAEEAIQYTGHDTTDVFQRTYMVLDPAVVAEKGRRVIEAVKATPVEAMGIALGALRIVCAGFVGVITAVVAIFPGYAMLSD